MKRTIREVVMASLAAPGGPTGEQLVQINLLADWLDLSTKEVLEMAIDGIPKDRMEGRVVHGLQAITAEEAEELVEELRARKAAVLNSRKSSVRGAFV